jgi:hypothetical protein
MARTYIIRDLPQDLWQQAKHAAVDARISLRELLLRALRDYLAKIANQ